MPNFREYRPERDERPKPRDAPPKVAVLAGGRIALNPNARKELNPLPVGRGYQAELLCDPDEQIIGIRRASGPDSPEAVWIGGVSSKEMADKAFYVRGFSLSVYIPAKGFFEHYGIPLDEVGGKVYAAEIKDGVLQVDLKHPEG